MKSSSFISALTTTNEEFRYLITLFVTGGTTAVKNKGKEEEGEYYVWLERAYMYGFFKNKRTVLYDTLIQQRGDLLP
ncbi:hypothetical protein C5167_034316 [Papaver somniferum]|uniref:Uncharacterized protein n=1 Tax=Papaver somniferum TaxID=3469 RepID=A0A4Y7KE60_PAPSO|nr:hypothetical protein C5167_034316 [Papaver somniferum]